MYLDVDAAVTVHVNLLALLDDTTFKDIEEAVAYDAAGMDLNWNFITSAGVITQTNVTPTTGGDYDWTHVGNGIYKIEIPASGGASVNNDTEGYGWFSGVCDGVLPWCGPRIGFRAAGLNDKLCDSAYSTTRGLAGTAVPDAAADAAGGLTISDTGGLDLDAKLAETNEVTAARMQALTDWIEGGRLDLLLDAIPTTAMRGTDNAALASVCTEARLAHLDADISSRLASATYVAQTGDSYDRLGAPAGASVSADVAAAKADTGAIKVATDQLNFSGAYTQSVMMSISGSEAAAGRLKAAAALMVTGTVDTAVNSHTPTTTEFQADDVTEATADHYKGRVVIFRTGALTDQATEITGYELVGGIGQFTVTALTEAPGNDDTFLIV